MTVTDAPQTGSAPAALPDLRPALAAAQQWVADLVAGIRPEQWGHPTPCTDFDVTRLVQHLYGVADRVVAMGHGQPAASVPAFVDALPEDVVAGFTSRTEEAQREWSDDASLARPVTAPWGTMPGAFVLGGYLSEFLAHGWDLAMATGQPSEADPALVGPALAAMQRALPAEPRGGPEIPFGPVVESAPDAGPTERLANWLGRSRSTAP